MHSFYPHDIFEKIAMAVYSAPQEFIHEMEISAGRQFPVQDIFDQQDNPTFEGLERIADILHVFLEECPDKIQTVMQNHGHDIYDLMEKVQNFQPFRSRIMPEYIEADGGGVTAIPYFSPKAEGRRFSSLGQVALSGAASVSVFDHPIKAEPIYDTSAYLDALDTGEKKPDPVGVRSKYRVSIFDAELLHPARHPSDLPSLEIEANAEDEGLSL